MAAIISLDGSPVGTDDIARMTSAMTCQGAGPARHAVLDGAALGICETRTTAEAKSGSQPLASRDGHAVIIFDGYLANYDALLGELKGAGSALRGRSDAELVLQAYLAWGADCMSRIDGEFAFVIWDARTKTAFAARDHMGLRPLFWTRGKGCLYLASEFAALHAVPGLTFTPNERVLVQLMAARYYFSSETVWNGITRLLPAHTYRWDAGRLVQSRYWSLPAPYSIRHASDGDYIAHYRDVLRSSVSQASRSDRPAAVEVSGGLDSSAVFAISDELLHHDNLAAPGIAGFSLAGTAGTDADERHYAEDLAASLGRRLTFGKLHIPGTDWFCRSAQSNADIPYFPNAAMTLGMYQSMRENGCTIALNGIGGDEWLNGRATQLYECMAHGDWAMLARSLAAIREDFGAKTAARAFLRRGLLPLLGRPIKSILTGSRGADTSGPPPQVDWVSNSANDMLAACWEEYRDRIRANEQSEGRYSLLTLPMTTLVLEHAWRLRSHCGIEGRHPMLSRQFIAFSTAIPEAMRLRGRTQKYIHREAMRQSLPENLRTRADKAEFGVVLEPHLDTIVQEIRCNNLSVFEQLIDRDGMQAFLSTVQNEGRSDAWKWTIWGLFASRRLLTWGHDEGI